VLLYICIRSGDWSYQYVYWIAEFFGAAFAALIRIAFGKFGLPRDDRITEQVHVHHQ
jgi:hypothetical protein